jgi:hypothetical protein
MIFSLSELTIMAAAASLYDPACHEVEKAVSIPGQQFALACFRDGLTRLRHYRIHGKSEILQ